MNLTNESSTANQKGFLLDLIIYLSVMFLIREVYFEDLHFIANGLMWSSSTLIVAMWRMKVRNISWKDLGLRKPENLLKTFLVTVGILAAIPVGIMIFKITQDFLPFTLAPDMSSENAASKFGDLKGNWIHFFTIIPFVLIQSTLEELLDRGFLITWFERLFSSTTFATVIAVLAQAMIFGFRHSYDLSERSVTVGIIGLVMGIAYVKFGRNLWPLIIAHCVLNTISMAGRVMD
ncbi:CPBP family intramembrane metalloprotease [Aureisphaera galaxeae]|uniref:CPBP family intramembrane glutamic endopeptidase n=1 Tax=Aureisphaera galaxeae TaxID=1538023 RepID=UPI002350F6C7|nr:CPBP family intramembrane glutamic endopeptidase [Aureisphaera galaxeae]MDC8003684.1 CPBP family intramembrane metalloprotease [Aureisphaera galaxeae]